MTALASALRVVVACVRAELEQARALGVDREIARCLIAGDLARRGVLRGSLLGWPPPPARTGAQGQRSASRGAIRTSPAQREAARRYEARKLADGRCRVCTAPRVSALYCARHLDRHRATERRWWRTHRGGR